MNNNNIYIKFRIVTLNKVVRIFLLSIFLSLFLLEPKSNAVNKADDLIGITTFNVLAPCWVLPSRYPTIAIPYLDRATRRKQIINFLNSVTQGSDIIALQETTDIEFSYFKQALDENFLSFQVFHDPQYWSDWRSPEVEWEPNGVALFVKRKSFKDVKFSNVPLSDDGNHAAYFEGIHALTGQLVRAATIHLDTDSYTNRENEMKAILQFFALTPQAAATTAEKAEGKKEEKIPKDFIIGDFNTDTNAQELKPHLLANGFFNALYYLGIEEWTSPYSDGDYKSKEWGIIDHIVTRNTTPKSALVHNFGLWDLYPIQNPSAYSTFNHSTQLTASNNSPDNFSAHSSVFKTTPTSPSNEDLRITKNLQVSGSDHFPVTCNIEL